MLKWFRDNKLEDVHILFTIHSRTRDCAVCIYYGHYVSTKATCSKPSMQQEDRKATIK